jgi:hypothetical protein
MNISKFTTYHTHLRHIFGQNERMIQSETDTALVANPRPRASPDALRMLVFPSLGNGRPRASPDAAPLHGIPGDPLQGFTLGMWP